MSTKNIQKRHKLLHEILKAVGICLGFAAVLYLVIIIAGRSLIDWYCLYNGLVLDEFTYYRMDMILYGFGLIVSVILFILLFFGIFSEKLAYIVKITEGIHSLQQGDKDAFVELVGNNELTELAEAVNYLSRSEKEIKEKEKRLKQEKEELIRTLSHDIRTPLTSIMSYTELFSTKDNLTRTQQQEYFELVGKKTVQIKEMTDILLDGGKREIEHFDDARLLFQQLASEFEEELEEKFEIVVEFSMESPFEGNFDVRELQRIFDNLISNINKYAQPSKTIYLKICGAYNHIEICQSNTVKTDKTNNESYNIGLNSIKRIAQNYGGSVNVVESNDIFKIQIILSDI